MSVKIDEATFYKGLYEAVINRSIKDLLTLSYSIWHLPISMIDIDYNLLGMYPQLPIGDETYDRIIRDKNISKDFKEKFIDEKYLINLHKCTRPFVLDWGVAVINHRYSFKLSVDGIIYGAVSMVLMNNTVPDEDDERCYMRIAEAAAKILSQSRQSGEMSATTGSLLIRFLLSGINVSGATAELYLGGRNRKRHLLVLVRSSVIDSPFYAEDIVRLFRTQLNESYINLIGDRLYIVLNAENDEDLIENKYSTLKSSLSKHGDFSYCVSSPFSDITKLSLYRDEVDFLSKLDGNELFFSDHISLFIASFIPKRIRAEIISENRMNLLAGYDRKYGTELEKTLKRYLGNLLDSAVTSTELNIHRNTLLNRLNRIEQITGSDLSKKDDVLEIIAYFIMKEYNSLIRENDTTLTEYHCLP